MRITDEKLAELAAISPVAAAYAAHDRAMDDAKLVPTSEALRTEVSERFAVYCRLRRERDEAQAHS